MGKKEVDELYNKLALLNKRRGYFFNPDENFTKGIITGLLFNEKRYGYQSCPCRLASGVKAEDLDIICPCDYRDADLVEYGACICGLYVSKENYLNKKKIKSIPERRPGKELRIKNMTNENNPSVGGLGSNLNYPVWRCQVCGYLCARNEAPDVCPICGAAHERFKQFM